MASQGIEPETTGSADQKESSEPPAPPLRPIRPSWADMPGPGARAHGPSARLSGRAGPGRNGVQLGPDEGRLESIITRRDYGARWDGWLGRQKMNLAYRLVSRIYLKTV